MQIRTRVKEGTTYAEVVDPTDGTVVRSEVVGEGQQFVVTATTATSPADLQFGEVEAIPEPEAEATESGQTEEETPAAGTEPPAPPAPESTTSAQSDNEKPLYRIYADAVPEGFTPSGLQTPDGFTLYHYEGDTAGEAATFDVGDGAQVGLYAEADDDALPVVPAPAGGEAQTAGEAEGAEAPADGNGQQPA